MRRDMDVVRKVLLEIEEQYVDVALNDLEVDGLDLQIIAYHCKILYEAHLISDYKPNFASGRLLGFGIGSLTWEGHEFLDKIRDDSIWYKTKTTIKSNGLPMILEVVRQISSAIITEMTSAVTKGVIKGTCN